MLQGKSGSGATLTQVMNELQIHIGNASNALATLVKNHFAKVMGQKNSKAVEQQLRAVKSASKNPEETFINGI